MAEESGKIKLIAGLGNPGPRYSGTRHNAGFAVIDTLAGSQSGAFDRREAFSGELLTGTVSGQKIFLLKPLTFMNLSGRSVAPLMRFYKIEPRELLLIYDEADIPFGRLRIRDGGSSGGHNGVESVITELGSAGFARLRVGVGGGADGRTRKDFVLSGFSPEERGAWPLVLKTAAEAALDMVRRGTAAAMNKYNGLSVVPGKNENDNKIEPKAK
jgi:PTH1 family peptidyl-tRNA hydrolase